MASDKTLFIIGCIFMALGILTGFVIPTAIVSASPATGPDPSWCATTVGTSFQPDIEPYRIASIVCFCIGILLLLMWVLRETSHQELRQLSEWLDEQDTICWDSNDFISKDAFMRVQRKIREMQEVNK